MSLEVQSKTEQHEGLAFTLQFIRNHSLPKSERLEEGKRVVSIMNRRISEIEDIRGVTHFVMGGLIHALRFDDLWKEFDGYQEWEQFSDFSQRVLNMSLSKCSALERIWTKAQQVGMEAEEIQRIGWPASDAILKVAKDRHEVDEWLDKFYGSANNEEFFEEVRATQGKEKSGEDDSTLVARTFRKITFAPDEADFFDKTIELAAAKMGKVPGISTNQTHCLLFIMTQWTQEAQVSE